jgi:hypothetical protein
MLGRDLPTTDNTPSARSISLDCPFKRSSSIVSSLITVVNSAHDLVVSNPCCVKPRPKLWTLLSRHPTSRDIRWERRQIPYYLSYFFSSLLCIPVGANNKTPFSIVFQQDFLPRDSVPNKRMFNLTAAILIVLLAHTAVQAATTTERPRCENVSASF